MRTNKLILILFLIGIAFASTGNAKSAADETLKLHYTFKTANGSTIPDESGNNYNGSLYNTAQIETLGGIRVLGLGTGNGYVDMGTAVGELIATLEDFTISTFLYIDESSDISGAGNFVWAFSTSSACGQTTGKYIAYRVNSQRYALSTGGWGNEVVGIQTGSTADKGNWHHVIYTQSEKTGSIYIDGQVAQTGTASYQPKSAGATTYNWLGRPHFSADTYLKGAYYSDFRIYNKALSEEEIASFQSELAVLTDGLADKDIESAKETLVLTGLDAVRKNLTLPTNIGKGVSISWSSSNTGFLSDNGIVTRPPVGENNAIVTLTATLSKGSKSDTKDFEVTILAQLNEQDAVTADMESISLDTERTYYLGAIKLPYIGAEGSDISWKSSDTEYLNNSGEIIKLPAKGEGIKPVTLTATLTYGNTSDIRDYVIKINEDEGFSGYLFAYFLGNAASQEQIYFALSNDGYTYKTLNGGSPVISGSAISDKGGVRDPHILRGPDGKFYMTVTDMDAAQGWSSNHGIVLLKSDDLINWTHSKIDVKAKFPTEFGTITRAWAPQTFYDEKAGKFMVYFSMIKPGGYDIIYYTYTNSDFTAFEEAPKQLFYHPENMSCIDGDIIYKDGKYNLFFKTEDAAKKGIKKAVSDNLTSGYILIDEYLEQTSDAVEGSCVFKLNNRDKYILMYDVYTSGKYEFTESADLDNFTLTPHIVSMDFLPRHGTIIPVTAEEAERLAEKWGRSLHVVFGAATSSEVKTINVSANETAKTVFIPVKYGTDLTNFDPQIAGAIPGINVSPEGPQDFSKGAVSYTLSLGSTSKIYSVTAEVNNNPVISSGYYADPEVLYSEKTGKFYIYPTSDGYAGWGGYYFKVFSSDDLVNWTDEGVIIDMHTDQVQWANGNAWAPCIIEKKINGEYNYFYYFSGGQDGGAKKIGVAVADHPTGPFTVLNEPLIASSPTGSGQQIDVDVFADPVSGKNYLYWGNGYLAAAELNEDMISLKTTPQVMTPSNFTEGIYIFYRNNKYYFTWSYGNTNNKDYRVYYGTADSPLGPISVPSNNNILIYDDSKAIYGPGHNSIIQIPGKDEWYMVYHRISRPKGINMSSPGNYREICIDKLEFNEDGTIRKVIPTLEGIEPVKLGAGTSIPSISSNKKGMKAYPTIVKDYVTIEPETGSKEINVSVYAIGGQLVMKKQLPGGEAKLDCSSFSKGWYILSVQTKEDTFTAKIFKE